MGKMKKGKLIVIYMIMVFLFVLVINHLFDKAVGRDWFKFNLIYSACCAGVAGIVMYSVDIKDRKNK